MNFIIKKYIYFLFLRSCLKFCELLNSKGQLLYPRNLKFRGCYGFGLDANAASAAAAAARQGLCFT